MLIATGKSRQSNSHWYTRDGDPCHEVERADGQGTRKTTVADARKRKLLPSVTTVLSILDKPQLMQWKIEQALYAAERTPRQSGETVEMWAQRVQDASHEQVEEAADLGTRIHEQLELAVTGKEYDVDMSCHLSPVLEWMKENDVRVDATEKRLVSVANGYAGTTDLIVRKGGRLGIIDYKSKKTKPKHKVDSYFEHKCQLSAYAAARFGEGHLPAVYCANIFISTTEPGRFDVIEHNEVEEYFQAFLHACALWRMVKNYDPRG